MKQYRLLDLPSDLVGAFDPRGVGGHLPLVEPIRLPTRKAHGRSEGLAELGLVIVSDGNLASQWQLTIQSSRSRHEVGIHYAHSKILHHVGHLKSVRGSCKVM